MTVIMGILWWKYSNPLFKKSNAVDERRAEWALQVSLEALIGCKLSSEPWAWKLFEDMHSCQKSQKHKTIIALSHFFSFTILVPIHSPQLPTYDSNDRQKYSLRSRRKRIKDKVGGLLKKSAKTNGKKSSLNKKMTNASPSKMLFLCGPAHGLPCRLEWVPLRVSHHILSHTLASCHTLAHQSGKRLLSLLLAEKLLLHLIKLEEEGTQLHIYTFFKCRTFLVCHFNSVLFAFPGRAIDFPKPGYRISADTWGKPGLLCVSTCIFYPSVIPLANRILF